VTGGAGFIGSHLVDELVKRDHEVTVLDHLQKDHLDNLAGSIGSIQLVKGSVLDKQLLKANMDVDVVFHLASCNLLTESVNDLMVNVLGTVNVLDSLKHDCLLVFSSSGSVYGNPVYSPQDEKHPCNPVSPYGISKLAAEHFINYHAETRGMKAVTLRYYNVAGTRSANCAITSFVRNALSDKPLMIDGDGTQKRCFTNIEDIVQANLLAIAKPDAQGKTFNIAGKEIVSINDLAHIVSGYAGKKCKIIHLKERLGEIASFEPSIALAEKVLGYESRSTVKDMIEECFRSEAKR
jgi:UDP-glucose 4-epimerase